MPLDFVVVGLVTRHGDFCTHQNLSGHCTLVLTFLRFLATLNVVLACIVFDSMNLSSTCLGILSCLYLSRVARPPWSGSVRTPCIPLNRAMTDFGLILRTPATSAGV